MTRKLPTATYYRIREPKNFREAMRADVEVLVRHRRYLALMTVIVCCLDAIAAADGHASRGKFEKFVSRQFPEMCGSLEELRPSRGGAATLYDAFRNGFAHLRGPKPDFAIVEDHEIDGNWAARIEIDGVGEFVGLNVDRLAREFLTLLDRI
jgi:hypothetical protein